MYFITIHLVQLLKCFCFALQSVIRHICPDLLCSSDVVFTSDLLQLKFTLNISNHLDLEIYRLFSLFALTLVPQKLYEDILQFIMHFQWIFIHQSHGQKRKEQVICLTSYLYCFSETELLPKTAVYKPLTQDVKLYFYFSHFSLLCLHCLALIAYIVM